MDRLTTKNYWDNIWKIGKDKKSSKIWKGLVRLLKKLTGDSWNSYGEHILWNKIYRKYLPSGGDLKLVEIGSAPGWNLVKFRENFGYDVYGIEFSPVGAEENRRRFFSAGLDPKKVIEGDFLSLSEEKKYYEQFDLVMSGGFIEHFENPKEIVAKHLNLLKPDGTLIVTVPNFQGVNSALAHFFYKEIEQTHNFNILKKEKFLNLFDPEKIEMIYGEYFGTFHLPLFVFDYKNNGRIKFLLYRFSLRFQVILNWLFRLLFKDRGCENKWFSPYIIFIGKKL